jgi:hypothetical protein
MTLRDWSPFLVRDGLLFGLALMAATAVYVWGFVEFLPRATLWGETAWRVGLGLDLLTLVV